MDFEINYWLLSGGLIIGLLLGGIIQRSKFCMSAAVSNVVLMKDTRQLHAYLAALAIAILGTQFLQTSGLVAISEAAYLKPQINWIGAVVGGLTFGMGTIFAGGCVGRTVVRVGEGNLGSAIVLLTISIMAAITMYGPLEPFRVELSQIAQVTTEDGNSSMGSIFEIQSLYLSIIIFCSLLAIISFSLIGIFGNKAQDRSLLVAGVFIGLLVVASWFITGYLSQDMFSTHRPSSISFAGPLANSAYIATTGSTFGEGAMFGLYLLFGTLAGAFLSAVISRSFNWSLPDRHHIKHLIIGGIFMGFGAVVAGGCNIGHGLSGASTCSITSLIALLSIAAGMRAGLFLLMKSDQEDFSAIKIFFNQLIHHKP